MYIRTKDGVYNTIHLTSKMLEHYKVDIIKRSKSLEKLCDKFVTLSKYSNRHYEYLTLKGAINMRKNLPFEVCEIYGCIWTSKGLTYVAKMNSKGDLELI